MPESFFAKFLANKLASYTLSKGGKLLGKQEWMQGVLQDLKLTSTQNDFSKRYLESLYAFRVEQHKDGTVMNFFREEMVIEAYYQFYYGKEGIEGNTSRLLEQLDLCKRALSVGDAILTDKIDLEVEGREFLELLEQTAKASASVSDRMMQLDISDIKDQLKQPAKTLSFQGKILGNPPFDPEVFLGRAEDLEAVHTKLFEEENLLLLVNGQGGIGKTSLAARYFFTYQEDYSHLAWVFAENSLLDALMILAEPLKMAFDPKMPNEERLPLLLDRLRELRPKPCLLIIDNANKLADLDRYYGALRSCPNFHILLTTRITEYSQAPFYRIQALADQNVRDLFTQYYQPSQEELPLLAELLEAVEKNTLVVELLAKNLANFNTFKQNYSLKALLLDLGEKGVLGIQNKEIATAYQAQGWGLRKETPERILEAMYDLSELPKGARQVLSCFAVLPAEAITYATLKVLLPKRSSLDEDLKHLIQSGWLDFNEDLVAFKVSPVVQEVALRKSPKLAEDCKPLVEALEGKLEYQGAEGHLSNCSYEEAPLLARYGETLLQNLKGHSEALFVLYDRVGYYYRTVGKLPQSQKVFEGYSEHANVLLDQDPSNVSFKNGLAISYLKLGETHSSLGNLDQALKFFEDETELFEELYEAYPSNVSFKNGLA
ncbi:MAG: NB-ARC domain-containing protein, partial [Bacteroidota bacterium]